MADRTEDETAGKSPGPLCWPAERAPDATVNRRMRPRTTRFHGRRFPVHGHGDEHRFAPAAVGPAQDRTLLIYKPPATAARLKIGRNMAMTMPPTTTPRKTISNGSISDVSADTVASHSVS